MKESPIIETKVRVWSRVGRNEIIEIKFDFVKNMHACNIQMLSPLGSLKLRHDQGDGYKRNRKGPRFPSPFGKKQEISTDATFIKGAISTQIVCSAVRRCKIEALLCVARDSTDTTVHTEHVQNHRLHK